MYPVPMHHRKEVDAEIERMLKDGIIERLTSPYINPIVPVIKKNGSVRACLDARELNKRLQDDHDGPEKIDEVLKRCAAVNIMSSIDLIVSFWLVNLAKESRKYTAFTDRGRTYHYKVVPFGVKVSGAALTKATEPVKEGFQEFLIDFGDDWLMLSKSFAQHLWHLEWVFSPAERGI